jgi:hypothetical protein
MSAQPPRPSKEETARRGQELYEQAVLPHLGPERHGHFVAIDVESGDYEVSHDYLEACLQLRTRQPNAWIWGERVGFPFAGRTGYLPRNESA